MLCLPSGAQCVLDPNKQFLGHFVDHMPSCMHVLLCVIGPLCFPMSGGGVTLGTFPRGCGETVTRGPVFLKGLGNTLVQIKLGVVSATFGAISQGGGVRVSELNEPGKTLQL